MARRCLARWARGRRVKSVVVHDARVLGRAPRSALAALEGTRFTAFDRRGKHLLLTLMQGRARVGLWSHLGMTGKWVRRQDGTAPRFSRVALRLDDETVLHYADLRLFGRLRVVEGADFGRVPELAALGPDPLHDGVDVERLATRLARSKKPIKPLLLDQRLLAGLGNIQASEALFRARIDPRRPAQSLTRAEVGRLAKGIVSSIADTLSDFAAHGVVGRGRDIVYVEEPGTPNPFRVYGREGERCPRCGRATIVRVVQEGRATFYCPRCQT
jgi:formamidopyrimidine-DNA glycosylase